MQELGMYAYIYNESGHFHLVMFENCLECLQAVLFSVYGRQYNDCYITGSAYHPSYVDGKVSNG